MDFDIGLNTMHGKLSDQNIPTGVNVAQEEDNNNDKNKAIMVNQSQNQESRKQEKQS